MHGSNNKKTQNLTIKAQLLWSKDLDFISAGCDDGRCMSLRHEYFLVRDRPQILVVSITAQPHQITWGRSLKAGVFRCQFSSVIVIQFLNIVLRFYV